MQFCGEEALSLAKPVVSEGMKSFWNMHKKDIHRFEQRRESAGDAPSSRCDIAPSRFIAEMYKKGGMNPNKIIVTRQGRTIRGLDVRSFRKFSFTIITSGIYRPDYGNQRHSCAPRSDPTPAGGPFEFIDLWGFE